MTARAVAERLYAMATAPDSARKGMLIGEVDGCPTETHPIAPFLIEAGFVRGALGYQASPRFVGSRGSGGSKSSMSSDGSATNQSTAND